MPVANEYLIYHTKTLLGGPRIFWKEKISKLSWAKIPSSKVGGVRLYHLVQRTCYQMRRPTRSRLIQMILFDGERGDGQMTWETKLLVVSFETLSTAVTPTGGGNPNGSPSAIQL